MKTVIIAVLFFVCLVLGIGYYKTYKESRKLKVQREVVEKTIYAEAKIVYRYKDTSGSNHITVVPGKKLTPKEADAIKNIGDTAALAIGILKKQIVDLTKINVVVVAEKLRAESKLDSQQRLTHFYKDRWLQLSFSFDSLNRGEFNFSYNIDLSTAQYTKKKWILGKKVELIDIYSDDPRATINSVRKMTIVKEDRSEFKFGPSISYNWMDKLLTPGITGSFDYKRLGTYGKYDYNYEKKKWYPAFGVQYYIIKF